MSARRAAVVAVLLAPAIAADRMLAHRPVTSPYTYTEDVYPIVSRRCGSCHRPGGIAPMSLLTYEAARPWAESIRTELTLGHMPPWFGDVGFSELKSPPRLSPRELDVLLTWVTGGTPVGPDVDAPPIEPATEWRHGRPDLLAAMPGTFTLDAAATEDTREFVLAAAGARDRFVRFVDLQPGNAAIVHDALIYTRPADRDVDAPRNVLAAWVPGSDPRPPGDDLGFRWPAGHLLAARIHYRRTWMYEGKALDDRSIVGVYLAARAPAQEVRSVMVPASGLAVDRRVVALGVRPVGTPPDVDVRVEARLPDGSRLPLVRLLTRTGWDRRYWLARPQPLPRGSRIDVTALRNGVHSQAGVELAVTSPGR
jgi:hypothetical protein